MILMTPSQITFEWHQHDQRTGEDAISGGHKGPVQVYIAKAPSTAASFDGQGTVWTKIYSSGLLNAQTQQWATDVVNANNGTALCSPRQRAVLMVALKQASTVLSFPLRFPPASTCSALRSWVSKPCPPYPSLTHVSLVQIALHVAQSYPGAQFVSGPLSRVLATF